MPCRNYFVRCANPRLGVNSVRFSIRIKQADEIEHILVHKFTRFLTQVRLERVGSASIFAYHNILACGVILYPSEEAYASTWPRSVISLIFHIHQCYPTVPAILDSSAQCSLPILETMS